MHAFTINSISIDHRRPGHTMNSYARRYGVIETGIAARTNKRCLFDDFYWRMNTEIHVRAEPGPVAGTQLKYYSSLRRLLFFLPFCWLLFSITCAFYLPFLLHFIRTHRKRFATLYSFRMIAIYRNKMCIQSK